MSEVWERYRRAGFVEMRPYVVGEPMDGVSISNVDLMDGSPKEGDMIARGDDGSHWLVVKAYFLEFYEQGEDV